MMTTMMMMMKMMMLTMITMVIICLQVVPVDGYQSPQSYLLVSGSDQWFSDQAAFWWMVHKSSVR